MILTNAISILLAYIIDLIVGDPKTWPHPVKMFGKLISFLDAKLNHHKRVQGAWMVIIVLFVVAAISITIVFIAYQVHLLLGVFVEAILIATTMSQKSLKEAALEVYQPLTENNLPEAREKVAYIVGRDTDSLGEAEITRATVETVAENTSDGITAPIFWAFVGGAPAALLYRAINTCDSMVGYKNKAYKNFGWASAKLDDIVNWIPARITGLIMLLTIKSDEKEPICLLKSLRKEAKHHDSPNSGWTEAAIALLLGIQLGGTNYYQGILSNSPKIGKSHRKLERDDIKKTIKSMQRTCLIFLIIGMIGAGMYVFTKTWG